MNYARHTPGANANYKLMKKISRLLLLSTTLFLSTFFVGCKPQEEQLSTKRPTLFAGKTLQNHKEKLGHKLLISNTNSINIITPTLREKHNDSIGIDKRFIEEILGQFVVGLAITSGESDELDVLKIPIEELTEVHLQLLIQKLCDNPTISNEYFKFLYKTDIPSKIDGTTAVKNAENLLALTKEMPNCDVSNLLMLKATHYTRYFSESEARKLAFDIIEREDKIKSNTTRGICHTLILLSYAVEDKYAISDEFVINQLKSNSISPDDAFNLRYWSAMNRLIDSSKMDRYLEGINRLRKLSEDDQLRKKDREYCKAIFQTMTEAPAIQKLINVKKQ